MGASAIVAVATVLPSPPRTPMDPAVERLYAYPTPRYSAESAALFRGE